VLPASNRLRSSSDFARTTKIGHRATSQSLILYGANAPEQKDGPQVGLIISKAVGGSVQRHRIARQLRHLIKPELTQFAPHTQIVIRVLRGQANYTREINELSRKLAEKISTTTSSK
jgi:ribonuclease P protein component